MEPDPQENSVKGNNYVTPSISTLEIWEERFPIMIVIALNYPEVDIAAHGINARNSEHLLIYEHGLEE